jgi:formamidopyrimidine-DNA glycosylase
MPELPEVQCLRRSLEPHLLGRTITRAVLCRRDICELFEGRKATPAHLLEGLTIDRLDRRGKQLAMISREGPLLLVHLGMTGQMVFSPSPLRGGRGGGDRTREAHIHAHWTLEHNGTRAGHLHFRDPRRFGGLWTFPSMATLLDHRWSQLGPDALTISPDQLAEALKESRRYVKAALLDQGALAGVGNIYADESLFQAGIRPTRLASALKPAEIESLAAAIRQSLSSSIATGGSTLRDYRDANGRAGTTQLTHAVYGRAREPCIRCGAKLKSAEVAQRTTVWCPRCQH